MVSVLPVRRRGPRENLVHLVRRAEGLGDAERNELAANAQGFVQQAKVEVVATQWRWLGRRRGSELLRVMMAEF